jgi:hypothetical protein
MSDPDLVGADGYNGIHGDIVALLEAARRAAARSVNAVMTATYWEIGQRIVEFEQGGQDRAAYGEALLARLSADLSARFGRGFRHRQKINFSSKVECDSIVGWTMMKPGLARSTKPFVRAWTSACADCRQRPRLVRWVTAV